MSFPMRIAMKHRFFGMVAKFELGAYSSPIHIRRESELIILLSDSALILARFVMDSWGDSALILHSFKKEF